MRAHEVDRQLAPATLPDGRPEFELSIDMYSMLEGILRILCIVLDL